METVRLICNKAKLGLILALVAMAVLMPLRTQCSELRYTWDSGTEGFGAFDHN